MSKPTVVDVFAGIGGLSLGFENAGFRCIAAVEYNPEHRKILAGIHPKANAAFSDVSDLDAKRFLRVIGVGRREIDVLVGGPPCQPFSMAGKRRGERDERGQLIHHFVRVVEGMLPRAFVMENVLGLQSIHGGRLIRQVLQDLRALGYTLSSIGKLNAADYGVPQVRRRIFLVGLLGSRPFEFPLATHHPGFKEPLSFARAWPRSEPYVTVDEAISDLPCNGLQVDDSCVEDDVRRPYATSASSYYQRAMRGRKRYVTGNQTSEHFPHIVEAIKELGHGDEEPRTRYRRLYPDRPAFTLRAGSGTFTALRPIHPHRNRVITVREAARLQSFPDWVEFNVIKKWAYQAIGNSVPPRLAQTLASRLLDFLG